MNRSELLTPKGKQLYIIKMIKQFRKAGFNLSVAKRLAHLSYRSKINSKDN